MRISHVFSVYFAKSSNDDRATSIEIPESAAPLILNLR